jgi:hypothetical protein
VGVKVGSAALCAMFFTCLRKRQERTDARALVQSQTQAGSCDALSYIWKVLEELSAALEVTRQPL